MGYDIEQGATQFAIRAADSTAALRAVRALFSPDDITLGSGGMFVCGEPDARVHAFAFVHTARVLAARDLAEALDAWRWVPTRNAAGDIVAVTFRGTRRGDEAIVLAALAPYIVSGSFIEMDGEDGARWRWCFTAGAFSTQWQDAADVWVDGVGDAGSDALPGEPGGYLPPTPWVPGAPGDRDSLR